MNVAHLIGNTGKDPEQRTYEWGTVVSVSLATTRTWKNKDGEKQKKTAWHNLEFRNKLGEVVMKFVKKGQQIQVSGEIDYQEYEKDGQKRYITKILCTDLQLLGIKAENTDDEQAAARRIENEKTVQAQSPVSEMEYSDDLPF